MHLSLLTTFLPIFWFAHPIFLTSLRQWVQMPDRVEICFQISTWPVPLAKKAVTCKLTAHCRLDVEDKTAKKRISLPPWGLAFRPHYYTVAAKKWSCWLVITVVACQVSLKNYLSLPVVTVACSKQSVRYFREVIERLRFHKIWWDRFLDRRNQRSHVAIKEVGDYY